MTILVITGLLGCGKTLTLTYLLFKNYANGRKLYANYHLKPPLIYTPIHSLDEFDQMKGGVFGADELWSWLDCRAHKKKVNEHLNKILLKSRKRQLNVFYTAQYFGLADKRLREITDIIAEPSLNKKRTKCTVRWFQRVGRKSFQQGTTTHFKCKPMFDLFDTTEEVEMIEHEKK